jgi:2-dehydro-3-deoxygluconokinase
MVSEIVRRLDEREISHELLKIEITETVIGFDSELLNQQIERFHKAGIEVWMDNFGAGYSSLNVLQDFDFDAIMEGASWFHWSGITPAISDKAAELTKLACEAAKRHGVTVSVDLNFRKKLWTSEKAISVMRPLMKYVDVCIGNEEDAELCLGFKPDADVEGGQTDAAGYEGIFKQMREEFGFKYVVSTLRESFSATFNGWKALIYDGKEFYRSKRYEINPIIDRVGGGDSFSGGLIHGLLTKPTQGEALEFAVAASALKHTINGDFNLVGVDEVESLAGGNANGRVQR